MILHTSSVLHAQDWPGEEKNLLLLQGSPHSPVTVPISHTILLWCLLSFHYYTVFTVICQERAGMRTDITNKYRVGFTGVVISQTATTEYELLVKPQNNVNLSDFAV
jgi:hypothetical protein